MRDAHQLAVWRGPRLNARTRPCGQKERTGASERVRERAREQMDEREREREERARERREGGREK